MENQISVEMQNTDPINEMKQPKNLFEIFHKLHMAHRFSLIPQANMKISTVGRFSLS